MGWSCRARTCLLCRSFCWGITPCLLAYPPFAIGLLAVWPTALRACSPACLVAYAPGGIVAYAPDGIVAYAPDGIVAYAPCGLLPYASALLSYRTRAQHWRDADEKPRARHGST